MSIENNEKYIKNAKKKETPIPGAPSPHKNKEPMQASAPRKNFQVF